MLIRILTFLFLSYFLLSNGYQPSKRDEFIWDRLTSLLLDDHKPVPPTNHNPKNTETPEIPPHRIEKRDHVTIPVYPWAYPLISWGFVNKDLNFAIDRSYKLFVSRDSLMTFTERHDVPSSDYCFEVQVSPSNRNIIFLVGVIASWVSTDAGVTFQREPNTNRYRKLLFHPTQDKWALAYLLIDTVSYTLQLTKDLGKTWRRIASGVVQYDWCRAGKGDIPEERICIIKPDENQVNYFYYSNDLGATWTKPLTEAATFFYVHSNFFTLAAEYKSNMDLYVSADDGVTFRRALLPEGIPAGTLQRSQFIEDDYGVIWIVVKHNDAVFNTPTSGNLYVSDSDGYMFTLALSDVHTINNWWDIEPVHSMEGTLLANVLYSVDPLLIKTTITWDNGATWHSLQAPTTDFNGTAYSCSGQCNLHLFGITNLLDLSGYGPFYTNPDATGMIIGTGSVGTYLPSPDGQETKEVNTFFSRDGGVTWDELMQGSTIYEYGDFGGLLVLASNVAPTSTIYYTINGGLTFDTVELPEKVSIINIITTSAQNERFLVISQGNYNSWKYWGIDFSAIHERNCTDTDYEDWEPQYNAKGPKCVLGHDITYERRKRNATCYTPDDFNQIVSIKNCDCDPNRDYECDFEFEETAITRKCVYQGNNLEKDTAEKMCADGSEFYTVSSGYRKLPADTCINDIAEYAPKRLSCGLSVITINKGGESNNLMLIVYIVVPFVVVVIIAGLVGFCIGLRDEQFRKKFPWIKAPAWVHVGYSNQLVELDGDSDVEADQNVQDVTNLDESEH